MSDLARKVHRVDVHPSDAHVRVLVGGEVVAETRRPLLLQETGYPDRYYIPLADIRADVLEPSDRQSHCPFKGDASYVSVRTASGTKVQDAAWAYREPIDGVAAIAGHLSFYGREGVVLEVDGRPLS